VHIQSTHTPCTFTTTRLALVDSAIVPSADPPFCLVIHFTLLVPCNSSGQYTHTGVLSGFNSSDVTTPSRYPLPYITYQSADCNFIISAFVFLLFTCLSTLLVSVRLCVSFYACIRTVRYLFYHENFTLISTWFFVSSFHSFTYKTWRTCDEFAYAVIYIAIVHHSVER